ncbi:MAG: plastocyanin/azurin family copper-binding protein [Haloferacaceae archaeon]
MVRRRTLIRAAAGALALAAGCSGSGGGGETTAGGGGATVVETTSVSMVDTQFDPRNVRVEAGAEVTWTNEDEGGHTVTAASDNWSLDVEVAGGERTSHAFAESGVYDVYCRFHGSPDLSGMSMKVAVGDATIEDPLTGGGDGGGEGGGY